MLSGSTNCVAPAREKEVPNSFRRLDLAIGELEAKIATLIDDLEPALDQNQGDEGKAIELRPSYSCHVAQGIDGCVSRVQKLTAAVADANGRLEL